MPKGIIYVDVRSGPQRVLRAVHIITDVYMSHMNGVVTFSEFDT